MWHLLIASTNKFKTRILKETWVLAGLDKYATLVAPEEEVNRFEREVMYKIPVEIVKFVKNFSNPTAE